VKRKAPRTGCAPTWLAAKTNHKAEAIAVCRMGFSFALLNIASINRLTAAVE